MLVMTIWHPGIKTRKQVTDLIASALCSPNYLLSTVSVVSTVSTIYYLRKQVTNLIASALRSPYYLLYL